jgi:Zn-dependent peptidase ImmA (M78 family)
VDGSPLGDVLALFEAKGLKVLRHPLPTEVSGFSAFTESWGGVVVVNDGHPLERQYFTALHELAHLVFHRERVRRARAGHRTGARTPARRWPTSFASAVLLPREVMERELRGWRLRWIPEPVLIDMKLRYRVSMRTVLFRAGALGLISSRQAGQQVGVLNRRFGPHHEQPELPKPERGPLGRLEWLTYRALVNEAITTSRAAEVLAMPLAEVRARLAAYMKDPATEGVAA